MERTGMKLYLLCYATSITPRCQQDWDSNGEIDFPEFVQAFSGWVNIEEEEFDD